MKIYKWSSIITLIVTITSFVFATIVNRFKLDFLTNVCLGIFASSILVFATSIISYIFEKKKEMTAFSNMINGINVKLIPIYDFFKPKNEPNIKTACEIINSVNDFMLEHLHMQVNNVEIIFPNTKLEKISDEINDMLYELYTKVVLLKNYEYEMKLSILNEEQWFEKFSEFVLWLRNYKKDDELFTNVLTEKHNIFNEMCKLKYNKTVKLNITDKEN